MGFHALTMECLSRFQRSSELQGHVSGDLKEVFDDGNLLVETFPGHRITHPPCNLARVLRGEIAHEYDVVDFSLRLRLKACDARSQFGNIGAGLCQGALPS